MKFYSSINNKIVSIAIKRMEQESIMSSKISKTQKDSVIRFLPHAEARGQKEKNKVLS